MPPSDTRMPARSAQSGRRVVAIVLVATACARADPPRGPMPPHATVDAGRDVRVAWVPVANGIAWRRTVVPTPDGPLDWLVVRLDLARVSLAVRAAPGDAVRGNVAA